MNSETPFKPGSLAAGWQEDHKKKQAVAEQKRLAQEDKNLRPTYFQEMQRKFDLRFRTQPDSLPEEGALKGSETAETPKNLNYDSDNLAAAIENGEFRETPTGLLDGIFLLGSTNSDWRKIVEPLLAQENMATYNPNMSNWDPDVHPKAEALGMSKFAVLAMRVENRPGLTDGSLGSLVEIGMAAFSALLNGQKFLLTFDERFEESLQETGAIAQFESIKVLMTTLEAQFPGLVTVEYKCSHDRYTELAKDALTAQRSQETALQPLSDEKIAEFDEKRKEKLRKPRPTVVIGGSSGAYSKSLDGQLAADQDQMVNAWGDHRTFILNRPPFTNTWLSIQNVEQSNEPEDVKKKLIIDLMNMAFLSEKGLILDSDVLLWNISDKATSKAAVTMESFAILNALATGQQLNLLQQKFVPDDFTRTLLSDSIADLETQIPDSAIVKQFKEKPESVTYKMLAADPLFKATALFSKIDNAVRTRKIADAQIEKVVEQVQQIKDRTGVELFNFTTKLDDYVATNEHQAAERKAATT